MGRIAAGAVLLAGALAAQLAPLSQVVGTQPMYLEYPVSLASPCLRPFTTSGPAEFVYPFPGAPTSTCHTILPVRADSA